jgi:hypothetical protein
LPAWASNGQLELTAIDKQTGKPTACRMTIKTAAGRPWIPRMKGVPNLHDHFTVPGTVMLKIPVGNYSLEIERGLEYPVVYGHFEIRDFANDTKTVELQRHVDMAAAGWYSGDLDVRRDPADVEFLMSGEDLHFAQVVTWQNDKNLLAGKKPLKKTRECFDENRWYDLLAGEQIRSGGAVLLFGLGKPLLAADQNPDVPPLAELALEVHKTPGAWVDVTRPYWWDLPTLVALGQVDSIEIAHGGIGRERITLEEKGARPRDKQRYPDPRGGARWSEQIYYHLLNCGLRIPPSAGSGSGATNNPVGYNRMYVRVESPCTYERWWESLRAGRVTITNGPLLQPSVQGQPPGATFQVDDNKPVELEIGLTLSIREPLTYLEIIKNGNVDQSIRFADYAKSGRLPPVKFNGTGWFLIRAVSDDPKCYHFAMTAPYFVQFGYQPRISRESARFFLDWVYQRARELKMEDPALRQTVLDYHRRARDFWQGILDKANAE